MTFMQKKQLTNILFILAALVLGALIYWALLKPKVSSTTPAKLSDTAILFASTLPDAQGAAQNLAQYRGKTLVINFWATWCPPCRDEMPELSALQNAFSKNNVVVIGIAIDTPMAVNEFLKEAPVSYPILLAEDEGMAIGDSLGNDKGVLPYTVIIDADGIITDRFFGRITQTLLADHLKPLALKK